MFVQHCSSVYTRKTPNVGSSNVQSPWPRLYVSLEETERTGPDYPFVLLGPDLIRHEDISGDVEAGCLFLNVCSYFCWLFCLILLIWG